MAPITITLSTPATYTSTDQEAAPLSTTNQENAQSPKGVGIAIGIAILVCMLVILTTTIYFCIRRRRMYRVKSTERVIEGRVDRVRKEHKHKLPTAGAPPPPPPPYERHSSSDSISTPRDGSRDSLINDGRGERLAGDMSFPFGSGIGNGNVNETTNINANGPQSGRNNQNEDAILERVDSWITTDTRSVYKDGESAKDYGMIHVAMPPPMPLPELPKQAYRPAR
ncbi:hypothetical protein EJ08DRAFT_657630 [Tothia fuscella]|uniref:Uncharacterized protein n=1 Tax=Tothia fuscella TaxID=1048955 RepID=A0A9P4NZ51_9PEZI|nr:hypothetical protein EJ08DRAFT_657630 [Tothia fuscella]